MTKIVVVHSEKGGSGKTTSATNLAVGLTREGLKGLIIDGDQAAHTTWTLFKGIPDHTIRDLFQGMDVNNTIYKSIEPNLDIIPSCKEFAATEQEIGPKIARDSILKRAIAPIINDYDFIIIDTQPSAAVVTTNTLCAADEIIVPIDGAYALEALYSMIPMINLVKESLLNPKLTIGGILLTKFNPRIKISQKIQKHLIDDFHELVFNTTIPQNVKLEECALHNQSIFEYEPGSTGALAYKELTKEIMTRWGMI